MEEREISGIFNKLRCARLRIIFVFLAEAVAEGFGVLLANDDPARPRLERVLALEGECVFGGQKSGELLFKRA
jgi:hypothetical protein